MSHSKIPTKTKFALRQEPREQTCDLFDKASFRPLSSCSSSAWIVSASPRPFRPAISCLIVEARGWFRDAGVRETCTQADLCTATNEVHVDLDDLTLRFDKRCGHARTVPQKASARWYGISHVCPVGAENLTGPHTCNGLRCVRLRGKAVFLAIGGRAPKWEPLNGCALEAPEGST
jgi:hypothetical protein